MPQIMEANVVQPSLPSDRLKDLIVEVIWIDVCPITIGEYQTR